MNNIPIGLLRSAVAIVDTGSMTRAGERVSLTPSAISMQVKRLEDLLQTAIFVRGSKSLDLTPDGELLVSHARRILALNDGLFDSLTRRDEEPLRLGLVHDVAESSLAWMLLGMKTSRNPGLYVIVACSDDLQTMMARGELDLIVCIENAQGSSVIGHLPMQWYGDEELAYCGSLPLAVLTSPCVVRSEAIAVLEREARPHHIFLESPSVSAIRAVVNAGLAVTCRTALMADIAKPPIVGLPKLPSVELTIYSANSSRPSLNGLELVIRRAFSSNPYCFPLKAA